MSILEDLPQDEYDFKSWNCYTLAQCIRSYYGLSPLPDFNWAVNEFDDEHDKPITFLRCNLEQYAKQNLNEIKEYDLILLEFYNKHILGTYVNNNVILMSQWGATSVPISRLSKYIDSIWTYET